MSQSTTKTAASSSPLLTKPISTIPNSNSISGPIPSSSATAMSTLALGRIALGASSILFPTFTFSLFKVPLPPSMTLVARMFGSRELALGEWLWTADYDDPQRKELKRAMRLNLFVDAADFGAVAFGVATGTLGRVPAGLLAGGVIATIGMDLWGLRGL